MTQTKNPNVLVAGLLGIIIGAGAVILTNTQLREKTKNKTKDLKNKLDKWSTTTLNDFRKTGEEIKDDIDNQKERLKEDVDKEK